MKNQIQPQSGTIYSASERLSHFQPHLIPISSVSKFLEAQGMVPMPVNHRLKVIIIDKPDVNPKNNEIPIAIFYRLS